MTKRLLFIPFMALLATSCGGGHITTTPVVKNAPSVSLGTPTKKNLNTPDGYQTTFTFTCTINQPSTNGSHSYALIDGTEITGSPNYPYLAGTYTQGSSYFLSLYISNKIIPMIDYIRNSETTNCTIYHNDVDGFGNIFHGYTANWPMTITGTFSFNPYMQGYGRGFDNGREEGLEDGYIVGYQEGEAYNNPIIQNGQYAGLTAFPRRHYLEILARRVVSGLEIPQNGHFDLIDTNANYTIYIKWSSTATKATFQDYGNAVIGELDWSKVISGDWSTSWFGKYDPELHQILSSPKYYATDAPIAMSFYPEVYLGSTIVGDVDDYFMGTANDYALGFADGQTYTIQASETYNNVFTIFTPAFRAVANFFNLNIGPFKIWYFFAIPLIVSLLILVLRLVKH